jgi:hypothetical protein
MWGNAETTVTVIAASIPILRVLIRDSYTSRRYGSGEKGIRLNSTTKATLQSNRVTVSGGPGSERTSQGADDDSDKSILGEPAPSRANGIVRTNAVVVEYQPRRDRDEDPRKAHWDAV